MLRFLHVSRIKFTRFYVTRDLNLLRIYRKWYCQIDRKYFSLERYFASINIASASQMQMWSNKTVIK